MSRAALLASSALAAIIAVPAFAADAPRTAPPVLVAAPKVLPAVSTINGKIAGFGGSIDGLSGGGVLGAVSFPVYRQWGAQADGMFGTAGGNTFWGAAGHFFWRDPSAGLLGVYGSWVTWSGTGATVGKLGLEGELYAGSWSFEGAIGSQSGDFSGIAGNATVAYYIHDNLRLDASYRFLQGIGGITAVGAEWQYATSGWSLFASAAWGPSNYSTIIGGLKLYVGPQKSLMRRQREDDPGVGLPLDLFNCGREGASVSIFDGICFYRPTG